MGTAQCISRLLSGKVQGNSKMFRYLRLISGISKTSYSPVDITKLDRSRSIWCSHFPAASDSGDRGMKDLVKHVAKIEGYLKDMNKELKGFTGNQAKTNEQEAAEAVYDHLVNKGFAVTGPPFLNHKFVSEGVVKGEIDAVIPLEGKQSAILEVKSRVTVQDVQKFQEVSIVFKHIGGYNGLMLFVGGPLFESSARAYALCNDIGVVEVSGHRYRVVTVQDSAETTIAPSLQQGMQG